MQSEEIPLGDSWRSPKQVTSWKNYQNVNFGIEKTYGTLWKHEGYVSWISMDMTQY